MTSSLLKTPLADWHLAHGGRMVDFAGWQMPVQYDSIVAEHLATRHAAGLFDVSHMGRLRLDGPGSAAFLDRLLTRQVCGMGLGKIRYSLVCNEAGGVLDDVLVYHLQEHGGAPFHLLVVNASNRQKILDWLKSHLQSGEEVAITDQTLSTGMIAVQGPRALACVEPLVGADLGGLAYFTGTATTICGHLGLISRTGYTGEDGCELIVPAAGVVEIWEKILAHGREAGARPAGLGARDTLRLEAGLPLYGHELTETIDPFQAGLAFAVNLEGREFIGRQALLSRRDDPTLPRRVGLVLAGRRVARQDYRVLAGNETVGWVTSGTFSPSLAQSIAMAYVDRAWATPGRELAVEIRGSLEAARVVKLPFYTRAS
jgi:aminomethyltransferase